MVNTGNGWSRQAARRFDTVFPVSLTHAVLRDLANVQQTSSKCIQNTRANAGRLLDVSWIV